MKVLYINDLLNKIKSHKSVTIYGWLKNKRCYGGILFLNIVDSTGEIEVTLEKKNTTKLFFDKIKRLSTESSLKVKGIFHKKDNKKEIIAKDIEIINEATLKISPSPRSNADIFNHKYLDYTLKKRHLFIRNKKTMSIIRVKSVLLQVIREWFKLAKFIEIDTPILTKTTLYEDSATFSVDYWGKQVYLSQCAGLYIGAAIPAFEKVFAITPAFRAQPSRSSRHNPEFYHVKGQVAFFDLEETIIFIENMVYYITKNINKLCKKDLDILGVDIKVLNLKPPYPRIKYEEALFLLKKEGLILKWGKSLNEEAEKIISNKFNKPVFVTNMPCEVEPFPYLKDPKDPRTTKTADLIAPDGYGEIMGLAEFIYKYEDLIERIKEKNKHSQIKRFDWYIELMQYGNVPHSGFGMGLERLLRWLLKLDHVRDTFLFPRLYHRDPYP
jgi:asparaginyl-tRNA synthetase